MSTPPERNPDQELAALRAQVAELQSELAIRQQHLEFATDGIRDWKQRDAFVLDHIGEMILCTDPGGMVTYANQPFLRRMHYSRAMLEGRHIATLILHPELANWDEFAQHMARDKQRHLSAYQVVQGNNLRFTGRVFCGLHQDEQGEFLMFSIDSLYVSRDQVVQAAVQFESAFNHAPIGMALVSPEGDWLRVNQAVCSITGYSEAELLQLSFQDITHPEDLDRDLQYVQEMLAGNRHTYQMRKRYLRKDGSIVWILLSVTLVRDSDDQPLHFISQIMNITEQIELQHTLEARNEELRRIFELLSHELREPLRKQSLFASRIAGALPPELKTFSDHAERIMKACEREEQLLSDMQDFLGLDQIPFQPVLIALGPQVQRLQQSYEDASGAACTAEIQYDAQATLWADSTLLQQLMTQLLSNSVRFRHSERAQIIRINVERREREGIVRLNWGDQGVGINEAFARRAFDLFRQDRSTRGGSGLGLAIVRKIMQRHNGTVRLQQATPHGTLVQLDFPMKR